MLDKDFNPYYHSKIIQDKFFIQQKIREQREQNSALKLLYQITQRIKCQCNEDECENSGAFESCFACQKISDLIAELNKE